MTLRLLGVQLFRAQRLQTGAVQQQGTFGVLHHHPHTLGGQIRKHRHVGGASVQQGVQRHILLGAAVHTQTHRVGRANTPVQQLRGKRTGALVQFGIGEGAVEGVGAFRLGGEHLTGCGGRIQHGERLRMRRHRVTEAAQQGLVLHRVLGKRRGGQLAQGCQFCLGRQTQVVQGGALALRLRRVGGQPLTQAGGMALQLLGGVERRVHVNLAGDAVAAAGHAAQGEGRVSNGTGRDIVNTRGRYRGSGLVLGGSRQRQHRVKRNHVNLRTKQPGLGVTRGTLEVFLTSQRMLRVAGVLFLHRVQGLRDGAGRRNLHRQHIHRGTAGLRARRTQGAGRLRQGTGEHAVHLRHAERSLRVAAHTRQVRADGGGHQHGPGDGVLLCRIQQGLLGRRINAERHAHRLRRRGGGTTRQGGIFLFQGAARLPEGDVFVTGGGGGIVGVEQLLQAHAAGCRNRLTGGQGAVYRRHAGEAVERRESVGNHVGEGMVHPEEPAVTRHCAAHGHALIGGKGLGEQALRPGAYRRGQIRVRQG